MGPNFLRIFRHYRMKWPPISMRRTRRRRWSEDDHLVYSSRREETEGWNATMTQAPADDNQAVAPPPSEDVRSLPHASERHTSPVVIAGQVPGQVAEQPWGLPFYLFLEPFAVGKMVVDLSVGGGPGPELLRRAGALEVLSPAKSGLPLPYPSGGADIVISGLTADEVTDDHARSALFAEIHRVARPDGLCVVRVVANVLQGLAAGVSLRAAFADIVLEHFATVDIVEETPFRAVSYFAPGSDDLAVSEAMSKVGGKPSHLIALCTASSERTWHLSESLLVPIGPGEGNDTADGELAAWRAEVERLTALNADIARERDELREGQMMLQDRTERLGKAVFAMRKDVERYLRQISDDAAARELLTLERDQVRRRLQSAEEEAEANKRELEKERSGAQALRKEVARLRAARGTATGTSRGPV
jgi:SAM-dependent methyltransferase